MSLNGFDSKTITDFRGSWTVSAGATLVPANRSFVSQNVQYPGNGSVRSREGYATTGITASGKVSSMYHWLSSGGLTRLIYMESLTTVKMRNLSSGTTDTLVTGLTGLGATVAEAGGRAYIAVFTAAGGGATQVRVVNALISGSPADKAFHPPLTFTAFTATDTGAGLVTAGTHKFGFIFQSRTGFAGKPSPAPSNVFTPVSLTVSPGNRTVRLAITLDTPAEAGTGSFIYPIMTRADNPNKWYFVPDFTAVTLPASASGWSQNFDISVTDEDLANRGIGADDPNDHFGYLSQVVAGTGPFNPAFVATFGDRVVYGVTEAVTTTNPRLYISDRFAHQVVTEDQHVIYLPGQRPFYSAKQLGALLYVFGPRWTYGFADSGDVPATWAPPSTVSGQIGTPSMRGVAEAGPDLLFVASESGLYPFNGQYPALPMSEEVSDIWDRINWASPHLVQVVTDPVNRRVYVVAPLDGNTEISHLLKFDYTRGMDPAKVDFSLDNFVNPNRFASVSMVQDPTSNESALWIGPVGATAILKQDFTIHNDNGEVIDSSWQSGHILAIEDRGYSPGINKHRGASFGVKGSGTLEIIVKNRNNAATLSPAPNSIALASAPESPVLRKWSFNQENETITVRTVGLNHWFELDSIEPYWVPYLTNK